MRTFFAVAALLVGPVACDRGHETPRTPGEQKSETRHPEADGPRDPGATAPPANDPLQGAPPRAPGQQDPHPDHPGR